MKKKIIVFVLAVLVSFAAAAYRWNDSAHAIGLIKQNGGAARHAVSLESGRDSYMVIVTATVLPPYRGDARISIEGEPRMDFEVHASRPAVDLGLHSWPVLENDTLSGLKPRDRPALWVKLKPPVVDPVCGMVTPPGSLTFTMAGKEYRFCSEQCLARFWKDPAPYRGRDRARGDYTLAFTDTRTGQRVLTVPISLKGKEDMKDGNEHHH